MHVYFVLWLELALTVLGNTGIPVTINEEIKPADGRLKPKHLNISFTINSQHVTLNLTRNDDVYLGRRNEELLKIPAFYTDALMLASFSVWMKRSKRKYHGTFVRGQDVFLIKPVPRDLPSEPVATSVDGRKILPDHVIYKEEKHIFENQPEFIERNETISRELSQAELFVLQTDHLQEPGSPPPVYTIELLVVVDFQLYTQFVRNHVARGTFVSLRQVLDDIRFYFSHVVNGVALRYMNIQYAHFTMTIRLAGIYIAKTNLQSPWTEDSAIKDQQNDVTFVHADRALDSFRYWLASTPSLPMHDHAALFTGSKLWRHMNPDGTRYQVSGLVEQRGICSQYKVSINTDKGEFGSAQTLAHELGHNLGAVHDGRNNSCSSDDQFIMARNPKKATRENFKNSYFFSECSIAAFVNTIDYLKTWNRNCLIDAAFAVSRQSKITGRLPGRDVTVDEQCRVLYGRKSFYCGGHAADRAICRRLLCYRPELGFCFANSDNRAFSGTSCGNRKWCEHSVCVYNKAAPTSTDYCIYGDFKSRLPESNQTCDDVIRDTPWKCYQSKVKDACCVSCARRRDSTNPMCEYGDKEWWCSQSRTNCYRHDNTCCDTCARRHSGNKGCEYGDRAGWCRNTFLGNCYQRHIGKGTCCQYCARRKRKHKPGCEFGDSAAWCRNETGARCYKTHKECCDTCSRFKTNIKGCEFGDRDGSCTLDSCKQSWKLHDCCYTCRDHVKGAQTILPATPPVASQSACNDGDLATWCSTLSADLCRHPYNSATCCQTCKRILTTESFTTPETCDHRDQASWCPDRTPDQCQYPYTRAICCQTCKRILITESMVSTPRSINIRDCSGGDSVTWCRTLHPGACYDVITRDLCCGTCAVHYRGVNDCEYGDKYSWCGADKRFCVTSHQDCCVSCQ